MTYFPPSLLLLCDRFKPAGHRCGPTFTTPLFSSTAHGLSSLLYALKLLLSIRAICWFPAWSARPLSDRVFLTAVSKSRILSSLSFVVVCLTTAAKLALHRTLVPRTSSCSMVVMVERAEMFGQSVNFLSTSRCVALNCKSVPEGDARKTKRSFRIMWCPTTCGKMQILWCKANFSEKSV